MIAMFRLSLRPNMLCPLLAAHYLKSKNGIRPAFISGRDDEKASATFASDVGVANRGRRGAKCTPRLTGSRVLKWRRATMSESTYDVIVPEKGVPIKAWTKGVALEDQARQQLLNVAQMPFIFKWVAAMPDVHWGIGATVGSVIPTKGAIIPA